MAETIRIATNNDLAVIQSIVFTALQEYGLKPAPDSTDQDITDIESHYTSNQGYFCIMENDGIPIATGGLEYINANVCELKKMYMVKSARGKGAGKQLLEHLLVMAKEMGFQEVQLETAKVLREAIQLYEKYGFEKMSDDAPTPRCDLTMRIKLS